MTVHDRLLPSQAIRPNASHSPFFGLRSSLRRRIADWIRTAADYYAAATIYEQLARLSDAELHRLGLSRATLARDICQACDPAKA